MEIVYLNLGEEIPSHKHFNEWYFINLGEGSMTIDDTEIVLERNMSVYMPLKVLIIQRLLGMSHWSLFMPYRLLWLQNPNSITIDDYKAKFKKRAVLLVASFLLIEKVMLN